MTRQNKPNPRRRNGSRRTRLRKRVLAAYDVCWLCGRPVDKGLPPGHPWSGEVDEVIPVSRGGDPLAWDNVRLAHRICNEVRGNKSPQAARERLGLAPGGAHAAAHGSGGGLRCDDV